MRFIIFLLALIGCAASLAMGLLFLALVLDPLPTRNAMVGADIDAGTLLFDVHDRALFKTGLFLVAGAGLGLLGALCSATRRGPQGAVLFLLAALGPTLFNPGTLAYTGVFILAALLSLLVKPAMVEVEEPVAELIAD